MKPFFVSASRKEQQRKSRTRYARYANLEGDPVGTWADHLVVVVDIRTGDRAKREILVNNLLISP